MNETERTVLRLYGDGMTVKEISLQIRVSENMVRQYLRVNGVRKKKRLSVRKPPVRHRAGSN